MNYAQKNELKPEVFQRVTGVKIGTFTKMTEILNEADRVKKARGGRKNKLCIEDQLLMSLGYWREYRTYCHIGLDFGVSESTAYKTISWVEDTLIQEGTFALPGKKALYEPDVIGEVVLIDATETPIERPKKAKKLLFWEKEEAYLKDSSRRF